MKHVAAELARRSSDAQTLVQMGAATGLSGLAAQKLKQRLCVHHLPVKNSHGGIYQVLLIMAAKPD